MRSCITYCSICDVLLTVRVVFVSWSGQACVCIVFWELLFCVIAVSFVEVDCCMYCVNWTCNFLFFLCVLQLQLITEWLHERTEHLDIFLFFRPSLSGVLFPMFCLLVDEEYRILVF